MSYKVTVAVAAMCVVCGLIAACSRDGSISLPRGKDSGRTGTGELKVVLMENSKSAIIKDGARQLDISYDDAAKTLRYDSGDFHMEFGPNYFREYTSLDELILTVKELGPQRRLERYEFNGRTLEIQVDREPTRAQYRRFLEFYEADPAKNSLEGNRDGEVIASLLSQVPPKLSEMWRERDPDGYARAEGTREKGGDLPPMDLRSRWAEIGCNTAWACMATKCWAGGLANPVCLTCTTVGVACFIMEAFGWW